MSSRSLALCIWCALGLAASAGAQPVEPARAQILDRVRTLYVSAAYEEALAAMPPVDRTAVATDLEQYRALCLLALGREQEAVSTVERLVSDDPLFVPPAGDTSPRVRSMFEAARSRLVPSIVKREYGEAKASFEAKDDDAARGGFRRALDLIASLPEADRSSLADLRLLAAEFLDLSAARAAAPPPVTRVTEIPVANPEPRVEFVPPVPILERLPAWIPPNADALRTTYVGVLRVTISGDGRVAQATIVKSSHPAYDAAAVRAARQWTYRPATRGGLPVAAERDIQIRLIPR